MNEKFLKNSNSEATTLKRYNIIEKYILKGKINEMKQKINVIKKLNKIPLILKKMKMIKSKFENFEKYLKIKNNEIEDNLIMKKKKNRKKNKKKSKN